MGSLGFQAQGNQIRLISTDPHSPGYSPWLSLSARSGTICYTSQIRPEAGEGGICLSKGGDRLKLHRYSESIDFIDNTIILGYGGGTVIRSGGGGAAVTSALGASHNQMWAYCIHEQPGHPSHHVYGVAIPYTY